MTICVPDDIMQRVARYGQQHLLQFADRLTEAERAELFEQIRATDFSVLLSDPSLQTAEAGARAARAEAPRDVVRQPRTASERKLREAAAAAGCRLLEQGQVAVVTVAGGQGTRLGFDHPKGMFPIGPRSDRSLFRIFAEQIAARQQRHGAAIPWYVMTSRATHDETVAFFRQHDFFGLDSTDVFFFQQGVLPAVDAATGRVLMDSRSSICLSPDGHGGMVAALERSDALRRMARQGIEHVFYHQVDNPAVVVCDPVLLGLHAERDSQLTTCVVRKTDPSERMGVLVSVDGRTEIIEYSELTADQAAATDESGEWIFWAGNTAIHVFRRDFLDDLASDASRLPLHQARKKVSWIDSDGQRVEPTEPNAVKFERFIFDALPLADRTLIVEADREREFHPVKNAHGSDSPEQVRAALIRIAKDWIRQAGYEVADDAIAEISPLIALDAEELKQKLDTGQITLNDLTMV